MAKSRVLAASARRGHAQIASGRVERAVLPCVRPRRSVGMGQSDLSPRLSLTPRDSLRVAATYRDVDRALAQEEVAKNTRDPGG